MKIQRTKNAVNSISWGLINKVFTLILPFIIRTLVIYVFGVEYAGLNNLFSSILQVLNLAELGMSTAIVYAMYKPIAEKDYETLSSLLKYFKIVYQKIGIFVLGAGLCLIPGLKRLINGTYPKEINIYIIYVIYLLNTASSYLFFAYKTTLLSAYQRNDIASKINTAVHFFQNIMQLIIILVLKDFYIYLAVTVIFTNINNLLCHRRATELFPEIQPKGEISKENKEQIQQNVKGLMISKACQVSRNAFDTICISSFIGLTATTIYSNYYFLMTTITGFLTILLTSISAGIGNSIETESVEKNYQDLHKFNFMFMWVSGWCTSCFYCMYQPFMKIWMGQKLMLPFGCVILLCIYFLLLRAGDIRSQYFNACGLWWKGRWVSVLEAVANLFLNITLGYFFQIWGILIATILTILFIDHIGCAVLVFKNYFKGYSVKSYFLVCSYYFAVICIICGITGFICDLVPISGIFGLILRFGVCSIITNVLFYAVYRKNKWFNMSFNMAKRILGSLSRRK
ncbi:lipopolysaccharide biosynthesis protein [[Clostridium] polysaccharolyticum]|uniref:Membrane protein involved in the export of O-antigen and teichoic acid n=1 Tax=[Clostridium] polysaccharolyticum TaxID=29364 RepID=A0A1H9ZBU2_9FIRM|nr:hypothetical protein [[Clostridium] polysaccharolyticum]SES79089.1 Membrane protein involved in the export of O-antigen and teichoic acid [[Clostridium] polysaccharolyticum]